MANFDENNPGDSDLVSQFPANERAMRFQLGAVIGAEHDKETGRHKFPAGDAAARNALINIINGMFFVRNDLDGVVEARVDGAWKPIGHEAGTKLVVYQAAAPYGYVQDVSINDRVLRVVSSTGGGTGGSWTISGLTLNIAAYALTVNELPPHRHVQYANEAGSPGSQISDTNQPMVASLQGNNNSYSTTGSATDASVGRTSQVGSGAAHGHPGSSVSASGAWRPAYADVMVVTKQ
jgi:hypothetical protein